MAAATEPLDLGAFGVAPLVDPGDAAEVAAAFGQATRQLDGVPLPGSGGTALRFAVLAAVAEESPALARLVEGHLDALAILAELGAGVPSRARIGVWAAEPRGMVVTATPGDDASRLHGAKPYASGANELTHALRDRSGRDERLLFLLGADDWTAEPGTCRRWAWPAATAPPSSSTRTSAVTP